MASSCGWRLGQECTVTPTLRRRLLRSDERARSDGDEQARDRAVGKGTRHRWDDGHMVNCRCLDDGMMGRDDRRRPWRPSLHLQEQDTRSRAWESLLKLIEMAAADRREEFTPGPELGEGWGQILTLPRSISKLKHVKHLNPYRSGLVRIPPEIGDMTELQEFTPYSSHSLHWFPYEITRCRNLRESTVSTRALYGNPRFKPPFPRLPSLADSVTPAGCSVCGGAFDGSGPQQWWISLRVATDVLPLLVHACSEGCMRRLPTPAEGHGPSPHRGGLELEQPETGECGAAEDP